MKRYYDSLLKEHISKFRQMFFLAGPRQVGKTTCAKHLKGSVSKFYYFNWDWLPHRQLLVDVKKLEEELRQTQLIEKGEEVIIFDEIHKMANWKQFIKGFYDIYEERFNIMVTGSARLDLYQKGGDSLMGRYFIYRMHPLTVAELLNPELAESEIQSPNLLQDSEWEKLWEFGGFPEPFREGNREFYNRWSKLRHQQLFKEDLRDLQKVIDVNRLELLAEIMKHQVGQLTSYLSLAQKIGVSIPTVKRWLSILHSLFYSYTIQPWHENIPRSLIKEPKYYLWDWSRVPEPGPKVENMIASHLLKAIHLWTDRGMGDYGLYYLRDKEKREVDFLVTKDEKPWMIIEAKKNQNKGVSKELYYFQEKTQATYAFQVVYNMDYIHRNCFDYKEPIIVPARTFLSQLV